VNIHVSVYALAKLYKVSGDISGIAREGSGSACRSLYGGFVRWHQGSALDGSDSIATQIVPESHWPEMRILVLVVRHKYLLISTCVSLQALLVCTSSETYLSNVCTHGAPSNYGR
jgi:diphosphomevalonate decarboxylase